MSSNKLKKNLPSEEIVRRYKEGTAKIVLAREYGVHEGTIARRLKRAGVHLRTRNEAAKRCWARQDRWGIKRAHLKAAITNQQKGEMTKLEQEFYDTLTAHGIKVIPQYAFFTMNLDFAIPEEKIAIEVESGHWHEAYCQARDRGKFAELTKNGWDLIRLKVWRGQLSLITNCSKPILAKIAEAVCSKPIIWLSRPRIS